MATTTGPLNAGTVVSASGANVAWTNPANAKVSDAVYAIATLAASTSTNPLTASNYGFVLPPTAVILGITCSFQRYWTGVQTTSIQITKAGVAAGTLKAGTDTWPNTEAYVSYGGATDLWGTTLTASDINNSGFGFQIIANNPTAGSTTPSVDAMQVTVYWQMAPADVPKRYTYKTYTNIGVYLGELPNVISEFSYSHEINTFGGQITVECAQSIDSSAQQSVLVLTDESSATLTDESLNSLTTEGAASLVGTGNSGALIANGNNVVVTEYSYYYPAGRTAFRGQINRVESSFGGQGDTVKVLVYSDGADMDNLFLTGPPFAYTLDQSQTAQTIVSTMYQNSPAFTYVGQSFTVGAGITNLGAISVWLYGTGHVTVTAYTDSAFSNVIASSRQLVTSANGETQFAFQNRPNVTVGTVYYFAISIDNTESINFGYSTGAYAGGAYWVRIYSGSGAIPAWGTNTGFDLQFKTFSSSGNTTAAFGVQDPSAGMLQSIMNDYNARGGKVTVGNITATGLSVAYTFNTNTVYEGWKAILSLAPNGFYYYADVGTNMAYFNNSSLTADILLTRGKHIENINVVTTIESIKNAIYFTGGIPSGTTNLYKAYTNGPSIASYGQRLDRPVDNRVTLAATADAIGGSKLIELKDEMYETTVTVIDKTMDTSLFKPGMIIGFRGFGSFVDNLLLQIVRVEYTPEEVNLQLGIIPKRIVPEFERVTRGLIAEQTIANPTAPS